MINNIWFYFLLTPIVVSVLTLNSLFFNKGLSKPVFENALEYCVGEDNNFVYSDRKCIKICIQNLSSNWTKTFLIKHQFKRK